MGASISVNGNVTVTDGVPIGDDPPTAAGTPLDRSPSTYAESQAMWMWLSAVSGDRDSAVRQDRQLEVGVTSSRRRCAGAPLPAGNGIPRPAPHRRDRSTATSGNVSGEP